MQASLMFAPLAACVYAGAARPWLAGALGLGLCLALLGLAFTDASNEPPTWSLGTGFPIGAAVIAAAGACASPPLRVRSTGLRMWGRGCFGSICQGSGGWRLGFEVRRLPKANRTWASYLTCRTGNLGPYFMTKNRILVSVMVVVVAVIAAADARAPFLL
jgi:hypothetical protein